MDGTREDGNQVFDSEVSQEQQEKLSVPVCEYSITPFVGRTFETLEEGERFYENYADVCGFSTRKSTIYRANDSAGTILSRYVLCNREGSRAEKVDQAACLLNSDKQQRSRLSSRVGCMARVVLQRVSGGRYRIKLFNEGHTHYMVNSEHRYLMNSNRKVDQIHQMILLTGIKANIGPMRSFRFFKELVGGYDQIGCTGTDFKNCARDLRAYIDGVDAHILLEIFKGKLDEGEGFKYFFDVCEENKLKRLFWSDKSSSKNFALYGDAVSFDATYNTNRYKLIFTPFTGKDNHGSCVSFGAALITNEDEESYRWVLEKFVECMGAKPYVITTDQDPALRKAVAYVLPNTSHRFCMWHITMKVADKLPVLLRNDQVFKKRFEAIVWTDYDDVETFEEKWGKLMIEYNLSEIRWFRDMYEARRLWIPAFFRDIKMSGLFRTTSSSESENSFFKRFMNKSSDLVRLYMHYSSALDAQRSAYDLHNMYDLNGIPDRATQSPLERHAATVYSVKIFKDVQSEIVQSIHECVVSDTKCHGSNKIYQVVEITGDVFEVGHDNVNDYLTCNCCLFIRKGILCRHILHVMRSFKLTRIPDKYIVKRWTKIAMQTAEGVALHSSGLVDRTTGGGNNRYLIELCKCMATANGNKELGDRLYAGLQKIGQELLEAGNGTVVTNSKQSTFEQFYGAKVPETPSVKSPDLCNNKGGGSSVRRKTVAEKAFILAQKPKRKCANCQEVGHHEIDEEAVEKVCSWIRHGVVLQRSINGAYTEIEHENTKKMKNREGSKL